MQKKLEAELMSLAHDILKLKRGKDVEALKTKAYKIYEKLVVLSYIETYVRDTPQNNKSVEELIEDTFATPKETIEEIEDTAILNKEDEQLASEKVTGQIEEEDLLKEENLFSTVKSEEVSSDILESSLAKEFEHTVSLDVATDLFENAKRVSSKKSINEAILQQKNLQIDLNDRIAFVKHLFNGSQEDFNRVVSQLNTMSSEKEALSFLKMIKKEYNWSEKEIYEQRLLVLIERKFS